MPQNVIFRTKNPEKLIFGYDFSPVIPIFDPENPLGQYKQPYKVVQPIRGTIQTQKRPFLKNNRHLVMWLKFQLSSSTP